MVPGWSMDAIDRHAYKAVVRRLRIRRDDAVLEIGFGTGAIVEMLTARATGDLLQASILQSRWLKPRDGARPGKSKNSASISGRAVLRSLSGRTRLSTRSAPSTAFSFGVR